MDKDKRGRNYDSVFSNKVKAGKRRTYFFDVRKTRGEDYYITITESTMKFNGNGYERHKIFLYKEDFNRFATSLQETINHIKTILMPHYDYDEFTKRSEEYEKEKVEKLQARDDDDDDDEFEEFDDEMLDDEFTDDFDDDDYDDDDDDDLFDDIIDEEEDPDLGSDEDNDEDMRW